MSRASFNSSASILLRAATAGSLSAAPATAATSQAQLLQLTGAVAAGGASAGNGAPFGRV